MDNIIKDWIETLFPKAIFNLIKGIQVSYSNNTSTHLEHSLIFNSF